MSFRRSLGVVVVLTVAAVLALGGCGSDKSDAERANDLLQKGIAAQNADDVVTASVNYNEVLRLDPRNKFAYYNLGLIAQNSGDLETAQTDYRLALSVDPAYASALYNLAIVEKARGNEETAIDLYKRTIAADDKFASAFLNLGLLQRELGDKAEGDLNLRKAVALSPELAKRIPGGVPVG